MTMHEYHTLTEAQREAMRKLYVRERGEQAEPNPYVGDGWPKFIARCYPPAGITPYVGVPDWCGMFIGIELDGHTHS